MRLSSLCQKSTSTCYVLVKLASKPSCSVTTHSCKHLFVDAGHIAVESKIADKKDVRAVQQKRQRVYNEEDHKNLESLMYDTFLLRLEDAQVICIIIPHGHPALTLVHSLFSVITCKL